MEASDELVTGDDLFDDEYTMGEMLRTLSSCLAEEQGNGEADAPTDLYEDLLAPALGDVDLFACVAPATLLSGPQDAGPAPIEFDDDEDPGIAMFEEEAEMLSLLYEGCRWNDRRNCFSIQVLRGDTLEHGVAKRNKRSSGIFLNILRLEGYPNRPPEVSIEPWHNLLTYDEVHYLYGAIKAHCSVMVGTPLLSAVVSHATDVCDDMIRNGATKASAVNNVAELKALGVHIRSQEDALSPSQFLGGIGDLLSRLPKGVDVINVENVLRPDLASRFERMQRYFYQKHVEKVEKNKETRHLRTQQHILKMADIRPAFHGTRMANVGKIVRSGLLVPGQASGVQVATGARYGQGIYSSPDPTLALCYAGSGYEDYDSVKLMVVAVLMGKEKVIPDGEEPWGGGCTEGFDSHISQDGKQFIVFHEAQILPCYVLHLMFRKQSKGSLAIAGTNRVDLERSSHQQGTKTTAILTQMARKNLPFGFGPRGSNFVVEEIAECSDDEEDWGQFQELRGGGGVGNEEYQHETLLPPPPPPPPSKAAYRQLQNPNR